MWGLFFVVVTLLGSQKGTTHVQTSSAATQMPPSVCNYTSSHPEGSRTLQLGSFTCEIIYPAPTPTSTATPTPLPPGAPTPTNTPAIVPPTATPTTPGAPTVTPTSPSMPTNTPVPPPPSSLSDKISVFMGNSAEAMNFINAKKPKVVVLLNNISAAQQIKQYSPGTIVIGRIHDTRLDSFPPGADFSNPNNAQQLANSVWLDIYDQDLGNPHVDFWQIINEPQVYDAQQMRWLAAFDAEAARIAASPPYNTRVCIANFGTGQPFDANWWADYSEAFSEAQSREAGSSVYMNMIIIVITKWISIG
jgi:hypothetical protein